MLYQIVFKITCFPYLNDTLFKPMPQGYLRPVTHRCPLIRSEQDDEKGRRRDKHYQMLS